MKVQLFLNRKLSVRVHGGILYRAIFGDEWQLDIHRAWSHLTQTWGMAGKGGDDDHHQVKKQRLKAN